MWNKDSLKNIDFYKRDGTGKAHRKLPGIETDFAKVDGRSFEDLIYFANQYSELIKFYDINNEEDGNWKAFIENDITTQLTIISGFDSKQFKNGFETAKTIFTDSPSKDNLRILFQINIDACFLLEKWNVKSVKGLKLNQEIDKIVNAGVSTFLSYIIAYDKGNVFRADGETEPTFLNCYYQNFSKLWYNEEEYSDWASYMASIQPDSSIYDPLDNPGKMAGSILDFADIIFSRIFQGIINIINNSGVFIKESIESWPYHNPHLALYFSFLKIFSYAQDEINTITKKHLEFYFNRVLKFSKKPAVPDSSYLIFELAKNVSTHKLYKGTKFNAGKDALGKDLTYCLDEEIVLNKAKVAGIKNIYLFESDIYSGTIGEGDNVLQSEKWKTFGKNQKNLSLSEQTMESSEIGFAVASPILLLKEGKRIIKFEITFQSSVPLSNNLSKENVKVSLSGEKEWIEAEISNGDLDNNHLVITAILETEAGAIVPYDNSVLEGGYNTGHPVAKFVFIENYLPLLKLQLKTVEISVKVSGITNLILQNDLGRLDPKKPFLPFGNKPVSGSNFYIGNCEIFKKKPDRFSVDITWQDLPYNLSTNQGEHYYAYNQYDRNIIRQNSSFITDVEILSDRSWDNRLSTNQRLFISDDNYSYVGDRSREVVGSKVFTFTNFPGKFSRDPDLDEFSELSGDLSRGFIRFKLGKYDFLHSQYPMVYTNAAICMSKQGCTLTLPNEPYTPKIESIKASYTSHILINFSTGYEPEDKTEQFFHIHPFGFTEFEPLKNTNAQAGIILSNTLLPDFKVKSPVDGQNKDITGSLFIGIEKLLPPQNLSLFFEMVKGSADPDLEKPSLIWSYLSENNWINFTKDEISDDTTEKLSQSGILKLQIPNAATKNNTILNKNYHWLRAAIINCDPANLCQAKNIYCQAAKVTFIDNNNDPDYLNKSLPAKTISKLVVKDSSVKTIIQPVDSFWGKAEEDDLNFSIRISERLRHKNRAVTLWDYEHLVLENFEEVYKVKCLNHLNESMENAPGNITLVVVPQPGNKDSIDILQPKLSVNIRDSIKNFMSKYTSAFANLAVKNPYFSRLKVIIKVDFIKGYDVGYYLNQLNNDIIKYITPWAYGDTELKFNNTVHFSGVLNYVEELSYIDHVINLRMIKTGNGIETETREAKAERPDEILVSADEHIVLNNEC